MSYKLEFEIDHLPAMPNEMLGSRWQKRAAHAKKWERLIWAKCWHLRPPQPLPHAQVTITRCSSRCGDFDGLVGAGKVVLDGLVKCGILFDDGPEVVGRPEYLHELVGRGKGKVRVKVEGI